MEQGTGIEPAFTAWEAVVLPIYEPCKDWIGGIIADRNGKIKGKLAVVEAYSQEPIEAHRPKADSPTAPQMTGSTNWCPFPRGEGFVETASFC